MTEYKRIDDAAYSSFGKNLLSNKGSDEQIEFLKLCKNGKDEFLNYLDKKLLSNEGAIIEGEGIFLDHKFTEAEFRFPPKDTQKIIWDTFKDVPRENMTLSGFWCSIIVNMIKHDCIKPDYLASNLNGFNETGIYMLDSAINSGDNEKIDSCVRRVLRSMGNSAPRGKRIVFNDFYLGKAYWRWNWANKMLNEIDLNFDEILDTLGEKGYSTFSEKMHKQKRSYISQKNTLGGLLLFLSKNPLTGQVMGKVIDTISYLSAWKAIEIQSPELNKKEIEIIAKNL